MKAKAKTKELENDVASDVENEFYDELEDANDTEEEDTEEFDGDDIDHDGDGDSDGDGSEDDNHDTGGEASGGEASTNPPAESVPEPDDFRARIWNAEVLVRTREATVEHLKTELKEARSSLDAAIARLRRVAQECKADANRPLFPMVTTTDKAPYAVGAGGDNQPSDAASAESTAPTDPLNGWGNQPFRRVIERATHKVNGLGKKKVDALLDKFKTFSDFEAARTAASKDNLELSHYMPKGIGQTMATAVEEIYLEMVLVPLSEPEATSEFRLRADELIDLEDLDSVFDQDVWDEGWSAWEAGKPIHECPYVESPDERDEWLRGWVMCDLAPEADAEAAEALADL